MRIIEAILFTLGILLISGADGNYGLICAVAGVACIGIVVLISNREERRNGRNQRNHYDLQKRI
jgi:drug/metabolite transporter (DMT)-like permease